MRQRGFALFDVLLALILLMIAAGASYTLVKSFRANSSTQQFVRYAATITQSFMPFIDGNSYASVLQEGQLAKNFLNSIGISAEDQVTEKGDKCTEEKCYVNSGMYLAHGSKQNAMSFGVKTDNSQNFANYFIIAVKATGSQVNQILQNASSMFSIYCPPGESAVLDGQDKCTLQSSDELTAAQDTYSLFLVFPKSGDTAPTSTGLSPP